MTSLLNSLALLALLLCCLTAGTAHAALGDNEAIQKLLDWVVDNGAELKVKVAPNELGIRGVMATEDIPANTPTMKIPNHLVLSIPAREMIAVDMAPFLIRELMNGASKLQPYMNALPGFMEVVTGYNFPRHYMKHLNSEHLVALMEVFKENSVATWNGNRKDELPLSLEEAMQTNQSVSLELLEYATALVASRTIQFRTAALSMIPVADLVNHRGGPPGDCFFDEFEGKYATVQCYRDIKKGEEITITYGDMRCDILFLYYGFVDAFEHPIRLASIDHHEYNPEKTEQKFEAEYFNGTGEEMEAELTRLTNLLAVVDKGLEDMGPIPDIPGEEAFKFALQSFHKARRLGITNEIVRLQGLIAGAGNEEEL
eukprot:gene20257-27011_t